MYKYERVDEASSLSEYNRHISTISCNILNANQNSLLSLPISYIHYFYHVFPLHPNTFHNLFHTHTLPGIDNFKIQIYCFTSYVSQIVDCQIDSLCQFQSIMSEFQSDIDCDIQELNSNIDYPLKFNSFVTKCVKSYLCKYIKCIKNHYCSCYNSVKENLKTLECIQKCLKSMLSELNGYSSTSNGKKTSKSEGILKRVFSNVLDSTVSNSISWINANLPIRRIDLINFYYTHVPKFLDESNPISKTTGELRHIKNYVSQFSGDIGNYNTRIQWYLIHPLSRLISPEFTTTLELLKSVGNGKNGNGIYKTYQAIKHKVEYCKSSLEFEKERLESISNNAKMLQKHLELIIAMLNKHQSNMKGLEQFKSKLKQLEQNKDKKIKYLTSVARSMVTNLDKIRCISKCLNSRKDRVSITTIKGDIENINSAIKSINNILTVVKSHLEYLFGVKLGVDCKIVNEIESCILEIVCEIHNKYCCLSSDISQINSGVTGGTSTSVCQLCEIVECSTTTQTGGDSCERCQGGQSSQGCQCCQKNSDCLKQLTKSCSESNIKRKLECIKKVICKLIDGKPVDGCNSDAENQQCSQVCQKGQSQISITCPIGKPSVNSSECKGTNIRELIKCTLAEINKFQSSYKLTCQSEQEVKCTDPPRNGCQATGTQTNTSCSQSTGSTVSNCNQLDKVKLCIDTMINKCNCSNLKQSLKEKNIKSCVDVFKWVMITNFRELFCLYSSFDKSILDQIISYTEKLEQMKFSVREMLCIQSDIKSWIDCIKNEINGLSTKVESLENNMKSGIREMDCAIEGVARNLIECSLQSCINNRTFRVVNENNDNKTFFNAYQPINPI